MKGTELKERRERLELKQHELAERFGVRQNTVARWENGVLKVPTWLPLALETVERQHKRKKK